jgi:hypothetical protein
MTSRLVTQSSPRTCSPPRPPTLRIIAAKHADCSVDVSVEIAQGYVGLVIWTR